MCYIETDREKAPYFANEAEQRQSMAQNVGFAADQFDHQ